MNNPKRDNTYVAVKVKFKRNGQISYEWMKRAVNGLANTTQKVRCILCEGEVRVHLPRTLGGPAAHVEHLHRYDSEHCPNGIYFLGVFQKSQHPVT